MKVTLFFILKQVKLQSNSLLSQFYFTSKKEYILNIQALYLLAGTSHLLFHALRFSKNCNTLKLSTI
jgi:hypothetical protein